MGTRRGSNPFLSPFLPELSVANLECQINHPKSDQETRGGTESLPSPYAMATMGSFLKLAARWGCCYMFYLRDRVRFRLLSCQSGKREIPKSRKLQPKSDSLFVHFLSPNVSFLRILLKRRRGNNDEPHHVVSRLIVEQLQ